ncbi:paraquat-inducible protein A [Maritimibacter sp. DP1N21-5]|uniref:paraquat-inducible protein A n=1 Tax=Maritimibacter sp. DP1N21-5 TaxID=2836867 RepID=UPI001C48676D|nr:paraquat-inducible protein A [Maritimibacter sp. DP1N21-5]MBV7410404.1 paraquat-inducible protein A [Maritimibacter sp. DP1N21-5]
MSGLADSTGIVSAADAGLAGCRRCGRVRPLGTRRCDRCGARIAAPDRASLQNVWAWLIAGLVFYVPANVFPMLITTNFGRTSDSTILGGVVELATHGDAFIAFVVFFASVIIPLAKFGAIAVLCASVGRDVRLSAHRRQQVFEVVEFVGRWSMVDVFVVALLAALVQFDMTASIKPGIAAVSFALSVIFTMIAALSFDNRLLWIDAEQDEDAAGREARA